MNVYYMLEKASEEILKFSVCPLYICKTNANQKTHAWDCVTPVFQKILE